MVLNRISEKHDLRPILEALLDELSRGSPPTIEPIRVEWIIEQGKPSKV